METKFTKKSFLSLAMLLSPFVICLTFIVDLLVNIDHYQKWFELGINYWPYFAITLAIAIAGLASAVYVLIHVLILKKNVKHIRTVIILSHLGFICELTYIMQYVYVYPSMAAGAKPSGISIAALVLGILGIVAFFVAMFLPKGPNFIAYYIASILYIIFLILMVCILTTRDNGMHIILLVFCTLAIALAGYGIYYFYLRKEARK